MIQIDNLYKSFGDSAVLKGVSLEIPTGQITVILGPSGCGKSVLLKNLIGLLRPDSGHIIVDGQDLTTMEAEDINEYRRKFGMLFQNAALFDSLSVAENVAFPLREHTDKSDAEIMKIVDEKLALANLVGHNDKFPDELSGGMRKRVGLARAIALEPEIILYDEPTTGLDPLTAESINQLIVTMQKTLHVTSVIISHDIESTFKVADHVAILYEGRVLESGPPAEFRHSKHEVVQRFIQQGLGRTG